VLSANLLRSINRTGRGGSPLRLRHPGENRGQTSSSQPACMGGLLSTALGAALSSEARAKTAGGASPVVAVSSAGSGRSGSATKAVQAIPAVNAPIAVNAHTRNKEREVARGDSFSGCMLPLRRRGFVGYLTH
jgi:hypothetical protein